MRMPTLNIRFVSVLGQSKGQETRLDGARLLQPWPSTVPSTLGWFLVFNTEANPGGQ